MKLLHRDIIAVHEEVQQVDGKVSGCRTQPETVADDGYEVRKVSPEVELRGLTFEGRQLELLLDNILCWRHECSWSLNFGLTLFCHMHTQNTEEVDG